MSLQVGQTLWFVESQGYRPVPERGQEVVVSKIGRKWAELGRGHPRISLDTLWAEGSFGSSPGRCYHSKEAYLEEIARRQLWSDLARRINQIGPPAGVSEDTIRQVASMLQIPLS